MSAPVPGDLWARIQQVAASEVAKFARSAFLTQAAATGGGQLHVGEGTKLLATDAGGNHVLGQDGGGEGLDYPRFDLGQLMPTAYALWAPTSSATLASVAEKIILPHHPRLLWNGSITADAGTQGTVQLYLNGTALGAVHTSLVGGQTNFQDIITLPAGFYDQLTNVQAMGQVTSGTGAIRVATWGLLGLGSS